MTFQNSRFSAFYQSRSCVQIIFNPLGKLKKTCLSCYLGRGPGGMSLTPLTKCLDLSVTAAALIGDGGPPTPNTASGILCSNPCPSPSGLPPSHLPPPRPAPGQSGFLSSLRPVPYWTLRLGETPLFPLGLSFPTWESSQDDSAHSPRIRSL